MKKSTIIATCFVNSNMFRNLEEAEHRVEIEFNRYFPKDDFNKWNSDVNEASAEHIINIVGIAMEIDIERFILDLWNE